MRRRVCKICLRSDFERNKDIDEKLSQFYDELVEFQFNTILDKSHKSLAFCQLCEHLLTRFYNFRSQCLRARDILKSVKKLNPDDLCDLIPPSSIGFMTPSKRQQIYYLVPSETNENAHVLVKYSADQPVYMAEDKGKNTDVLCIKSEPNDLPPESVPEESSKNDFENDSELFDDSVITFQNEEVIYQDEEVENEVYLYDDIKNEDVANEVTINEASTHDTVVEYKMGIKYEEEVDSSQNEVYDEHCYSVDDDFEVHFDEEDETYSEDDAAKNEIFLNEAVLRDRVLHLIDTGDTDLGNDVSLTRETFLEMFEKCDMKRLGILHGTPQSLDDPAKIKKFLKNLVKRYNPDYDNMFSIQYLHTQEQKIAEFESRRQSREYLTARYRCDVCYRVFDSRRMLDQHKSCHDTSLPFFCTVCPSHFVSRARLRWHAHASHDTFISCKLCPFTTHLLPVMENHYNAHKGKRHRCDVCLEEFSTRSLLKNHRRTHATLTCPLCSQIYVTEHGLKMHIRRIHQDVTMVECESVPCDECADEFESRDLLLEHIKLKHNKRTKGSKETTKATPKTQFRRVRVVGPDKTCPLCRVEVPYINNLCMQTHFEKEHPDVPYSTVLEPRAYLCDECGKSFRWYCFFKDHMNTHTGARPYACRVCPRHFATRTNLMNHAQRHAAPRHACKQCGKMFRSNANLFNHRRIHIGDRRYKCETCNKGFLTPGSLKEHVNGVHNNIKRIRKRETAG